MMNASMAAAAAVALTAISLPTDAAAARSASECFVEAGFRGTRMPESTLVLDVLHEPGRHAEVTLFDGSEQYGLKVAFLGHGGGNELGLSVVDLSSGESVGRAVGRAGESMMFVASAEGSFTWRGRTRRFDSLAVQCHPRTP